MKERAQDEFFVLSKAPTPGLRSLQPGRLKELEQRSGNLLSTPGPTYVKVIRAKTQQSSAWAELGPEQFVYMLEKDWGRRSGQDLSNYKSALSFIKTFDSKEMQSKIVREMNERVQHSAKREQVCEFKDLLKTYFDTSPEQERARTGPNELDRFWSNLDSDCEYQQVYS